MEQSFFFLEFSPDLPILPQPSVWVTMIVLSLVTGWSSLLAHKTIANFHDGVRPLFPEFMAGRMSRRELATKAFGLSLAFVVGYGIPFTLASGLVMIYLLLLPADVIGSASRNNWVAFFLGVLWGATITLLTQFAFLLAVWLPVNFIASLSALYLPFSFALLAFPALAVAFQFGPKNGLFALLLTLIVYLGIFFLGINSKLDASSFGMIAGILFLIGMAIFRDRKERKVLTKRNSDSSEDLEFSKNAQRVRKNLPWLLIQGALLAFASRLWIFGGSEADFALLATGDITQAAFADIFRGLAFMPLIIISTLTTGVYQAVGFTFVYAAGFLSPNPWIAPLAGALVILLEVLLLNKLNTILDQYPSIREAAEHLRGSLAKVIEVAALVGSAIAANSVLPGGLGLFMFFSLYVLNEAAGQRVFRIAAGPLSALAVGLIANLLVGLGLLTIASS